MQVHRDFDPETAKWLETVSLQELKEIQQKLSSANTSKTKPKTQAQRILEAANNPACNLQGMSDEIIKNSKEFREDFEFKHDQ